MERVQLHFDEDIKYQAMTPEPERMLGEVLVDRRGKPLPPLLVLFH